MRPLSGVAVIFILLTDLSAGLRVVTGSSCFSDRNIWDFLSPEAAVAGIFLLSSKVNLQYSRWHRNLKKKNTRGVQMVKASHITEWLSCVGLEYCKLNILIFFPNPACNNLVKLKSIFSNRQTEYVCEANSLPKHSPSAIWFPTAVVLLKLSYCRFSSAWQKCLFLPVKPFSGG